MVSERDTASTMREAMVREQIAARGVRNAAVLAAMGRVPRHEFVPAGVRFLAYDDRPVPIGLGQTISQPYIVALMTELAGVGCGSRVLEIGTLGVQKGIVEILAQIRGDPQLEFAYPSRHRDLRCSRRRCNFSSP